METLGLESPKSQWFTLFFISGSVFQNIFSKGGNLSYYMKAHCCVLAN